MDVLDSIDLNKTENEKVVSTIAMFKNFSPDHLIKDAVILFWESHTDNTTDKKRIQATSDLIRKTFDVSNCEAYEVRTGYLSRYNFLPVEYHVATQKDWDIAIAGGLKSESDWVKRCNPYLPGFKLQEWDESVSKEKNPYFEQCRQFLVKEMERDPSFKEAFYAGINDYAERHCSSKTNGSYYMLEEMSWIFSLGLVYWSKPIYLIHVGNDNPGIKDMFKRFPNLSKSVKWLSPKCRDNIEFTNLVDFLTCYRCTSFAGYSYAVENRSIIEALSGGCEVYEQRRIA